MGHHYNIPNDGRTHTRFSHLSMCTDGQVDRLIEIINSDLQPFSNESTEFGTQRHEMFEAESKRTGKLPQCFYEIAGIRDVIIDHVEKEYAVELAPGVVVHSRPDAVCAGINTIFDYKTVKDGKEGWQNTVKKYRYPSNRQTTFYALMLHFHGIAINRAVYLCEIWDADYKHILGYDSVERVIAEDDLKAVHEWALRKILYLKAAIQQAKEVAEFYAAR